MAEHICPSKMKSIGHRVLCYGSQSLWHLHNHMENNGLNMDLVRCFQLYFFLLYDKNLRFFQKETTFFKWYTRTLLCRKEVMFLTSICTSVRGTIHCNLASDCHDEKKNFSPSGWDSMLQRWTPSTLDNQATYYCDTIRYLPQGSQYSTFFLLTIS